VRAELLLRAGAELAEGPLSLTDGTLAWVDILRGEIHRLDRVDGSRRVTYVGEPVGSIVEATDGPLIAACRSRLRHLGDEVSSPLLAALPDRGPDLRMNDGKADPAGRFVGGTMTLGTPRPGAGSLWSSGPDGPIELVTGFTVSNGLAWSTDGETSS
jgi:sugar lactone lactonase YvrE